MSTRARDEQLAYEFLEGCNIKRLLKKYPECQDAELKSDLVKLGLYLKLREEGAEHVWALMSACRRAPALRNSEQSFFKSNRQKMEQMGSEALQRKLAAARKAGISTQGKFHMSGLGPASDPGAWVSGMDDVLAVCKARNLNCEGAVNHKARPVERKKVKLSERLTREMEQKYLAEDPALAERCKKNPKARRELREKVVATHGAKD